MTLIICDSSFIILISKLELIDLLIKAFKEIYLPQAVFNESVKKGKMLKKMDAFMIEERIQDKGIKIKNIRNHDKKKGFMDDFNIHEGEAEAIILFFEEKADLLATDDYRTLKTCKVLNIKYFTTPLFIIRSFLRSEISKEKTHLKFEKLQELGWYKNENIIEFKNKLMDLEKKDG
jgi:predicted nucleic acid-binding protein